MKTKKSTCYCKTQVHQFHECNSSDVTFTMVTVQSQVFSDTADTKMLSIIGPSLIGPFIFAFLFTMLIMNGEARWVRTGISNKETNFPMSAMHHKSPVQTG